MPPQAKRIALRKTNYHIGTIYILTDSDYGDVMAAETTHSSEYKDVEFYPINTFGIPIHFIQKYTKILLKSILEDNADFDLKVHVEASKDVVDVMEKEFICVGFTIVVKCYGLIIGTRPKRTLAPSPSTKAT